MRGGDDRSVLPGFVSPFTGSTLRSFRITERGKQGMYTGDINDDDADVIKRLTMENAEPPNAQEKPQELGTRIPASERPPRPTRFLTGTMTIGTGNTDPVQILWTDTARMTLLVNVYSATATDSIKVMDEAAKNGSANSTQMSASLPPAGSPYNFSGHTGPLYIAAEAGTAVRVSWVAVTK